MSGCTAAVQSYSGLVTVRFVLGIVEAPFFPGAVFLVSASKNLVRSLTESQFCTQPISWYAANRIMLDLLLVYQERDGYEMRLALRWKHAQQR